MPLVRVGSKLVLFAHVPKCAGTSVEDYLAERFGPLALMDRRFYDVPPRDRWGHTSPQHMPARVIDRLFPPGFVDAAFAVVRNPHDRFRSAFLFQRDVLARLPPGTAMSAFLDALPGILRDQPWRFDGHMCPMDWIVPEGARVFRLEDGLDAVVEWLDELSGSRDGPRHVGVRNRLVDHLPQGPEGAAPLGDRDGDDRRVAALYARDFARFGYAGGPEGVPDVGPGGDASGAEPVP